MLQRILERIPQKPINPPKTSGLENKTEKEILEENPQKGRVTPKTQSIFEPGFHEPSPALLGGESQDPQNSAKILWVKENQNPINNNNNLGENTTDRGDPEEPSDPSLRGGSPRYNMYIV